MIEVLVVRQAHYCGLSTWLWLKLMTLLLLLDPDIQTETSPLGYNKIAAARYIMTKKKVMRQYSGLGCGEWENCGIYKRKMRRPLNKNLGTYPFF